MWGASVSVRRNSGQTMSQIKLADLCVYHNYNGQGSPDVRDKVVIFGRQTGCFQPMIIVSTSVDSNLDSPVLQLKSRICSLSFVACPILLSDIIGIIDRGPFRDIFESMKATENGSQSGGGMTSRQEVSLLKIKCDIFRAIGISRGSFDISFGDIEIKLPTEYSEKSSFFALGIRQMHHQVHWENSPNQNFFVASLVVKDFYVGIDKMYLIDPVVLSTLALLSPEGQSIQFDFSQLSASTMQYSPKGCKFGSDYSLSQVSVALSPITIHSSEELSHRIGVWLRNMISFIDDSKLSADSMFSHSSSQNRPKSALVLCDGLDVNLVIYELSLSVDADQSSPTADLMKKVTLDATKPPRLKSPAVVVPYFSALARGIEVELSYRPLCALNNDCSSTFEVGNGPEKYIEGHFSVASFNLQRLKSTADSIKRAIYTASIPGEEYKSCLQVDLKYSVESSLELHVYLRKLQVVLASDIIVGLLTLMVLNFKAFKDAFEFSNEFSGPSWTLLKERIQLRKKLVK
jgi:hypothetical protein